MLDQALADACEWPVLAELRSLRPFKPIHFDLAPMGSESVRLILRSCLIENTSVGAGATELQQVRGNSRVTHVTELRGTRNAKVM